jgi:glycosyltransferase involved in cell wall biosynthesis
MNAPVINILVPCYNEQEVLRDTAACLLDLRQQMMQSGLVAPDSGIVFIDDGSRDATWSIVQELAQATHGICRGIKLSRNRGHQNALLAGLRTAPGDALVSIDADLQDDVQAIEAMVRRFLGGCDIVYGVRRSRKSDTAFKRRTARAYYRALGWLGVETVPDHADFRLLSRRAVNALGRYTESNQFLRALVPQLGFRNDIVFYDRRPRLAGTSKYPLRRMISFAIDGITSFSMRPLRLITLTGMMISLLAFATATWALATQFFFHDAVPGWTSIVISVSFIGGLQLLSLGVIGEYVGKIYIETKRRPLFEIESATFSVEPEMDGVNRLAKAPVADESAAS